MYFKDIFNTEAERVIKTRRYDGMEVLDELNEDIWIKENHDTVLRLFPLFNVDEIVSSNDSDVIIEVNKAAICENIDTTILNLNSTGIVNFNGLNILLYSSNNGVLKNTIDNAEINIIVYDDDNKTIPNQELGVYCRYYNESTRKLLTTLYSDSNGEAYYNFSMDFTKPIIITIVCGETESNELIFEFKLLLNELLQLLPENTVFYKNLKYTNGMIIADELKKQDIHQISDLQNIVINLFYDDESDEITFDTLDLSDKTQKEYFNNNYDIEQFKKAAYNLLYDGNEVINEIVGDIV